MEVVEFRGWRLRCDPAATRDARRDCVGAPERCGCLHCRNFAAARARAYPPAARALFARLGVDARCESEVYYGGPIGAGLHLYGGWFHFVGMLDVGPEALGPRRPGRGETGPHPLVLVPLGDRFRLGFTTRLGLVPAAFGAASVVQLEFEATLPWVLDTPPSAPAPPRPTTAPG